MTLLKTDRDILTPEEILAYIAAYERDEVPRLDRLWNYYQARDPAIINRKIQDPNNPDNRLVVAYGRKIVNTFVGYAYRPGYTTYKARLERDLSEIPKEERDLIPAERYARQLQDNFALNEEHIKTSRAARNMAIFGRAYELFYVEAVPGEDMTVKAEPRFFPVDPREVILLYDYASEPKEKIAIRYYRIDDYHYKVEVYYADRVVFYDRKLDRVAGASNWTLTLLTEARNPFDQVPVVAYYFGDEMLGVIEPVKSLIDANDVLYSDSMNEFDRFAYAYLLMKKFGLTNQAQVKDPGSYSKALAQLKRSRIIEHIPSDAEISFLTKDIPVGFVQFMADRLREQIHVQSHVPDFTSDKMAGASGIAIQRLLFDFENVCSSVEADFDLGLFKRIGLITTIYAKTGRPVGGKGDIVISHKRNMPLNMQEFAQTAATMKQAGFSSWLCADIMPDDVVPDVQVELARQKAEQEATLPDLDNQAFGFEQGQVEEGMEAEETGAVE